MTQEEILLDALEYYTVDPVGRRCSNNGICYYSPKTIHKEATSEGCLIGRLLPPELAQKIDTGEFEIGIGSVILEGMYRLPDFMNEDNIDFLEKCQRLHDGDRNWTDAGLSKQGIQGVSEIIERYNFDVNKFSKFLN